MIEVISTTKCPVLLQAEPDKEPGGPRWEGIVTQLAREGKLRSEGE
jgi:hypothetical protein